MDLPDGGGVNVPQGSLSTTGRFSRYTVEPSQAGGLRLYHPLSEAIRIEAKTSSTSLTVASLQKAATVSLRLSRPLKQGAKDPTVRVQTRA